MRKRIHLDINLLKEYIDYNSYTGKLVWRKNFFKSKIGKCIGSVSQYGYLKVTFKGKTIFGHRIAWAIHYGEQPPEVIDHLNGDRLDNRISNLREVSVSENAQNQRSAMRSNKTSRFLGVSKFKGRWRAKISVNGKYVFLGYFATENEARDAYIKEKRKVHKSCTI